MLIIPCLLTRSSKLDSRRLLVRIFAVCSFLGIQGIHTVNLFHDEVTIYFHVLSTIMVDRIVSDANCCLVVTIQPHLELLMILSSLNSLSNHIPSHILLAEARKPLRYFQQLPAIFCFAKLRGFPLQMCSSLMLTFDPLKNLLNQHLCILLSSCDLLFENPLPGVLFKYMKILKTASRCFSLGDCMNWLTLLQRQDLAWCAIKQISLPANLRYCSRSTSFPPSASNLTFSSNGVTFGLQPSIFVSCRRSSTYFCCYKEVPVLFLATSLQGSISRLRDPSIRILIPGGLSTHTTLPCYLL